MTFPLFHRPGTIVFLDDDPDYLEMLALLLPREWPVKLFTRPRDCIDHLQQEPPFWEADAWTQQEMVAQWRGGRALVPLVLEYWARSTERYGLGRVCVVDFSMPEMDGLQVLSRLDDWPGARVLLTGQADEQVAVDAFNRKLIDQFIPKQTADISRHLVDAVRRLMAAPHPRHAQTWRATLQPDQHALLRQPEVARDLATLAQRHWVEHVVVGEPFGILGLDPAGFASWLQLETPAGLAALAEVAQLERFSENDMADIRAGRKLVDLELAQALQRPSRLAQATPIGGGVLVGALFEVPWPSLQDAGYSRWLGRQPRRQVQA
jgi:CheY-like chemotaxis protein